MEPFASGHSPTESTETTRRCNPSSARRSSVRIKETLDKRAARDKGRIPRSMQRLIVLLTALLSSSCLAQSQSATAKPHFRDITATSGITFQHQSAPEKKF